MRQLGIYQSLFGLPALLLAACGYDNGPGYRYIDQQDTNPNPIVYSATIDTDATLEDVAAGQGVGMMLEYHSGGTWKIALTCDTAVTNLQCYWTVRIQSLDGSAIGGVDQQHLDNMDAVTRESAAAADVLWYDGLTTTESDEFTFQADPGKPIGFDVWLQDELEPNRYVFWISDQWLNRGIAGPSFDLYPSAP
jgi:hypothetical protein